LLNGALDGMTIPCVCNKRIQTSESLYKTFKMSEMNVVWRPVIVGSDQPIKGAKNKSDKQDQGVESLKRMLSEM